MVKNSFPVTIRLNTFILVDDPTRARVCLYVGNQINELVENGLKTKNIAESFEDCKTIFDHLIL